MGDYDLQINGADHLVAKRSRSTPERQKIKHREHIERQKRNNSPPRGEPSEGKSLYAPNTKTKKQKQNHVFWTVMGFTWLS